MSQSDDPAGNDQGASKKTGLNLDLLFGPAKQLPTSIGTLHLYGLRVSDMSAFTSLSGIGCWQPADTSPRTGPLAMERRGHQNCKRQAWTGLTALHFCVQI